MRMNFNGHCCYREVDILENKIRFLFGVNVWTVLWDKKKMAVVERWPLVEFQLVVFI